MDAETIVSEPNRLEELRGARRKREFDPFDYIIDAIQAKPSEHGLKLADKVHAAENLAMLEFRYEQLEVQKRGGGRGMRVSVGADGSIQADLFDDLAVVSDEQLESGINEKLKTLGFTGA